MAEVHNHRASMKFLYPNDHSFTIPNKTIVASIEPVDTNNIKSFSTTSEARTYIISPSKASSVKNEKSPFTFDLSDSDLTQAQKQTLQTYLKQNRDVFAKDLSGLGQTVGRLAHKIETYDAPPVCMPFYRQPSHMQKEIDRQVQDLLDNVIIEESNSEYHSPVLLVKKKDGKYRFSVDYLKLNKITKHLSFPLPRLECVFDAIAEAEPQIFSTFVYSLGIDNYKWIRK